MTMGWAKSRYQLQTEFSESRYFLFFISLHFKDKTFLNGCCKRKGKSVYNTSFLSLYQLTFINLKYLVIKE